MQRNVRAIDSLSSDWLRDVHEIHIVGIGGAGMSAIARVLHGWGLRVHGSDRRASPVTLALQAEGIGVMIGHTAGDIGSADLVLASSAITDDNVELVAARQHGIRVMRRPEFLTDLTAGYDVIAVAGTHGKTTVTGMIALTLREAGLDPTYVVGGVQANLGTNAHAGKGRHFVIEADEYRQTFLALNPTIAVVTNVEFDHPDCFTDLGHVRLAFGEFVGAIVRGGLLVACGDDEIARAVAASHHANGGRVVMYGLDPAAELDWRATHLHANERGGVSFEVEHSGVIFPVDGAPTEIALQLAGTFNVLNALATLAVAVEAGVSWGVTRRSLEAFEGTARRFEVLGEVAHITVIDDYAHHPTQIRGNLQAARGKYGARRLVAVWEPHTFSRVRALYDEFMGAFHDADQVVVMPIYAAREVDDGSLATHDLVRDLNHPVVWGADSLDEVVAHLAEIVRPGDVVLLMGAGNEYIVGERLIAALQKGND